MSLIRCFDKLWYNCKMNNYSAMKRNKILRIGSKTNDPQKHWAKLKKSDIQCLPCDFIYMIV